ncbi:alpha/beta-hydrolase [Laetiporus sulphureus 93-53]|uniref:Alpha/beta-hydrolase n=1 Tax=Laetiporus sulphureus 93-53 TaxID=1314785 RepID=A0A165BKJ1_9APHY|nr:alpha/beta-hydrolase [Laetiporus sulphureus 93-53]KZT01224.1 alpha/beta-hydrolase [Laetiporus sulphureus 93-53]
MAAQNGRYHYQQQMPFARQPLKAIYVVQRMFTTLLMVPFWVVFYAIIPRRYRPRESWSIKQIVAVNFTRRIYKVTELAGVTWGTRDPEETCDNRTLKETRFEWVDPLPEDLRTGIVTDDQVPLKRVGVFVWPKNSDQGIAHAEGSESALTTPTDIDATAIDVPLIGIFMHGGGYCHMSAHEKSPTSRIPRQLIKNKAFANIYAVEYRLLQHAPFPAAVQDAAAVYAHIVRQHQRRPPSTTTDSQQSVSQSPKGEEPEHSEPVKVGDSADGVQHRQGEDDLRRRVALASQNNQCKVVLIGDSAGGNLVLALSRWIRDEGILPPPDGLLLLSPSCDPSHAFPDTPSSYVPRPHAKTDYLVDTPEPRALLQRTFLGHNSLETMHSPYVSPASQRVLSAFYGDAFAETVQDLTIERLNTMVRDHLRTMESAPATPVPVMPSAVDGNGVERSPTSLASPLIASPRGLSLFSEFPKTCIVLGDAERLEREVMKLVGAMERDGVDVRTIWVKDGAHDVLMMGWWDERVRAKVWRDIGEWIKEI